MSKVDYLIICFFIIIFCLFGRIFYDVYQDANCTHEYRITKSQGVESYYVEIKDWQGWRAIRHPEVRQNVLPYNRSGQVMITNTYQSFNDAQKDMKIMMSNDTQLEKVVCPSVDKK